MDIETARQIRMGFPPPAEATLAELLQVSMGGCLLDNGDLWCIKCNHPNECCICHEIEEYACRDVADVAEDLAKYQERWECSDFNDPELLDKHLLTEGKPITTDEDQYCTDCGRSFELCDCATKDIP
jgi:hypothetical protein